MSVGIVQERVTSAIADALVRARRQGLLRSQRFPEPSVGVPRKEAWGDLCSGVAMVIAKQERRSALDVAHVIAGQLKTDGSLLAAVSVAPPGFVNLTLQPDCWFSVLEEVERMGARYGHSDVGRGQRVLLEFVSANPTGPLHLGHGRGAALGEALARVLKSSGYAVDKEYYLNDAGRQLTLLAESVYARYLAMHGRECAVPEDGYHGEYVTALTRAVAREQGERLLTLSPEDARRTCGALASRMLVRGIRDDLVRFGVEFETWFSEASLAASGKITTALEQLAHRDLVFARDGATWFRSSKFHDEKDRVVCRQDGRHTYLASDIAYHFDKLRRGYDRLINVWGADHHGYVPRMHAAIQAFGHAKERLRVVLVQMVRLLRDGNALEMSKRAGEFVTLREVVDEVGADAAKFFFLMRRADTHLDFDLELAKKHSADNPVYYVQYAHARLAGLFRTAREQGVTVPSVREAPLSVLETPEEMRLIKHLSGFPGVLDASARELAPHHITFYLQELAGLLHVFYYKHRVLPPRGDVAASDGRGTRGVSDDSARAVLPRALTIARLALLKQVQVVLRNGLWLLGVTAPERM